ncbi:response regulator transcription factor [Streptomyces sp. NBC_01190]|uniref:helix-turn-helix transcriptional regulator n=1 Tax=Streptomyces sp. NBC_01190 TaxID=2903767 RepID=UPI0038675022|nr:helix-turn-helix transcriptional regulator [Streptomyces sp. NBC_01190]
MRVVDRHGEVRENAREFGNSWAAQLVTICDPGAVCEVLQRALIQLPAPRRSVQLTGRFAAEAVNRPASDLSAFMRTEILGRGHGLRLLLTESTALEQDAQPLIAHFSARGADIRFSAGPVPNLALLAAELALVHTGGRDERPQILVARREATDALHRFQQTLWDHATDLVPPRGATGSLRLDPTQTEVLRMLGAGMKDDTAARVMNVSVRTYRRHVAAIMKSLHVSTRFEAGLKAAELGLLSVRECLHHDGGAGGRFLPGFLPEKAC